MVLFHWTTNNGRASVSRVFIILFGAFGDIYCVFVDSTLFFSYCCFGCLFRSEESVRLEANSISGSIPDQLCEAFLR
jgi:hypothetical protein